MFLFILYELKPNQTELSNTVLAKIRFSVSEKNTGFSLKFLVSSIKVNHFKWVMSMSYLIKWGVSFFCNFEDFIVPKKIKHSVTRIDLKMLLIMAWYVFGDKVLNFR